VEDGICVRLRQGAIEDYNLMFGRLKRIQMMRELSYYIKQHEELGKIENQKLLKLIYDDKCCVNLEKMHGGWDVVGFDPLMDIVTGNKLRV
jgi:hypothetical protein